MGCLTKMEENAPLSSRISTVVPATPRDDENGAHHLSYVDLLMKLHYVRAVCFFGPEAAQGLSISDVKKPMFPLLDPYPTLSGRIRATESGRPFIKCNDAGVRIAESHCERSLEEWFSQEGCSFEQLVPDHVLGPDLEFSPLVFVKFTWFKCGGLSVGLSWSHVLGDAFSAFNFITIWSHALAGHHVPPKSPHVPNPTELKSLQSSPSLDSISAVKKATINGERWLATTDTKVVTHTFYAPSRTLHRLATEVVATKNNNSYFEILSALVWKYIAQIRGDCSEPKDVTVCTRGTDRWESEFPTNGLELSVVKANGISIGESDVTELVKRMIEREKVERHVMEKLVEGSEGKEGFIVYGASLTFVDLEEGDFYGVKLNGHEPIMVNCAFHGVGDEGVVLVILAPQDKEDGSSGRIITVSLPEKELELLKDKLGGEWGIGSLPF